MNNLEPNSTNVNNIDIAETMQAFQLLKQQISSQILGQEKLVEKLLVALLAHGHLLVEGAPGLAKTTAIKALSNYIDANFHRVQFTPDLLPSDLTGTEIYRQQTATFEFQKGPLFHNLVLADEINRAPAKVQSALLEAMGEHQITVGKSTYALPDLFLVMATQNPIEQEGTYPLPEAQLDRFLMHVKIDYPQASTELAILKLAQQREHKKPDANQSTNQTTKLLTQQQIEQAQRYLFDIYMSENLENYLVELVLTTRNAEKYDIELGQLIAFGGSPRATIALDRCARAMAFLAGRDHVLPQDIHACIHDVLRHRLILTYEAEAQGFTSDAIIDTLLKLVPLP